LTNCIQAAFSSGGGGGATVTSQEISPTENQTTTSTTVTDISSAAATLADRDDGKAFCNFFANIEMSDSTQKVNIGFELDGTDKNMTSTHTTSNNVTGAISLSQVFDTGGGTLQLRWRVAGGTATLANGAEYMSRCTIFEVS